VTDIALLCKLGIPESLIREILNSGVTAILIRDGLPGDGIILGQHRPAFNVIELNRSIDRKIAAREVRKKIDVDISEEEIFPWILLHEFAHFKGYKKEKEADLFASERLAKLRGYTRRYSLTIPINITDVICKGLRQALK